MLANKKLFNPTGIPDNKKEKALKYPIENLYTGKLKRSGDALVGKCPFHKDDNPSFAIYPETNTWNCFAGCGGGDVVSFYMKLHNVSFAEAVERLQ